MKVSDVPPLVPCMVIAVVDDDPSIRAAVDSLLRSRGHSVRTFESAQALLNSSELDHLCAIIADVRMPTMGGLELQAMLRAQGRTQPFIFVTAFPESQVRARAMRDGAVCFLGKPFDGPTLLRCVEQALLLK